MMGGALAGMRRFLIHSEINVEGAWLTHVFEAITDTTLALINLNAHRLIIWLA